MNSSRHRLLLITTRLFLIALIVYGVACAVIAAQQERLIFFPHQNTHTDRLPSLWFEHDNARIHAWLVNEHLASDCLIIYFGGNAEDVHYLSEPVSRLNAATVLVNYRGYGRSSGQPLEQALVSDGRHIVHTLQKRWQPRRLIIMGRSIGSGVAAAVAAETSNNGLILITPFDSMLAVARQHYPTLPVGWLLRHPFRSDRHLADYREPVLIIRAANDQAIRPERTKALIEALHTSVHEVVIPDAGHNDLQGYPVYWQSIITWLDA